MQLTIYKNFSKKKNSTKRPSGGRVVDVVMKENTSVESPTFLIDGIDLDANYCSAFGHYYYIDDIRLNNNNIYELVCSQDVLATHKDTIGNTSAYILRSASEYDGNVVDNMYPVKTEVTNEVVNVSGIIDVTGSYVIGIVGTGGTTIKQGSVSYYAMTKAQLNSFCAHLFTESVWEELKGDYVNPLDNVVSCYWLPIDLTADGVTETITFGRFEFSGVEGYKIGSKIQNMGAGKQIDIPKHPQAEERGNYLNQEPFTNYYIRSSAFGNIPIPAYKAIDNEGLTIAAYIDVVTGQAKLIINWLSGLYIDIISYAQLGVPVALSQNTMSISSALGAATSVVGAVGAGVSGNVPGAIAGAVSAVDSAVGFLAGQTRMNGSNGSFMCAFDDMAFVAKFVTVADEDNDNNGRPLCAVKQISELEGYVLCSGASVDVAGLGNDAEEINNYLNNGFFYE